MRERQRGHCQALHPYRVKDADEAHHQSEKAKYNPATDRWEGVDPRWVESRGMSAEHRGREATQPQGYRPPALSPHVRMGLSLRSSRSRIFTRVRQYHLRGRRSCLRGRSPHDRLYLQRTSDMGGADPQYSKYAIMWVVPRSEQGGVPRYPQFNEMAERGNKYVVIDPRCSEEASKAYLWSRSSQD